MAEESVVKKGYFGITTTKPNGEKEEFSADNRELKVVGGNIVVVNTRTEVVTILPPGSTAVTDR
jgi:hypothetical protein